MHPNVMLPTLLEVEDGAWIYTIAITIIREDEEFHHLRTKSTRSKGKFNSIGGGFSPSLKQAVGTHGITRENEGYNCMPLCRSPSPISNSNMAQDSKRKKGLRENQRGPKVGSSFRPTKSVS